MLMASGSSIPTRNGNESEKQSQQKRERGKHHQFHPCQTFSNQMKRGNKRANLRCLIAYRLAHSQIAVMLQKGEQHARNAK